MSAAKEGAMNQSNIMLYGATGFSGGLIAGEGKATGMSREGAGDRRMILAARDGARLRAVAEKNAMDFRVFGLDDRSEIRKHLDGVAVVINAAGPFAFTAEPLAIAALESGCHYVDINGEIDVYRKLDDLAIKAEQLGLAMVSGAGASAAASDVLLDFALELLRKKGEVEENGELGAVRIAVPQIMDYSQGSAATVARSLRDQVLVIRQREARDRNGEASPEMVVSHEPVGKLERAFDFGGLGDGREQPRRGDGARPHNARPRIASAANMIDTLTAKHTVARRNLLVRSIESYIEMGSLSRIAYQIGGMLSPFASMPLARAMIGAQLSLLPEGPAQSELDRQRHVVVLEIEDLYRRRLVDWRWETPNVYQFTAELVVAIARAVAKGVKEPGWVTPAAALGVISLGQYPFHGRSLPQERQSGRQLLEGQS
jgi:short subunit dehydrogenase-like uncharacterized protein